MSSMILGQCGQKADIKDWYFSKEGELFKQHNGHKMDSIVKDYPEAREVFCVLMIKNANKIQDALGIHSRQCRYADKNGFGPSTLANVKPQTTLCY